MSELVCLLGMLLAGSDFLDRRDLWQLSVARHFAHSQSYQRVRLSVCSCIMISLTTILYRFRRLIQLPANHRMMLFRRL